MRVTSNSWFFQDFLDFNPMSPEHLQSWTNWDSRSPSWELCSPDQLVPCGSPRGPECHKVTRQWDQDLCCSFLYSLCQALCFAYERHLTNVARIEMTQDPPKYTLNVRVIEEIPRRKGGRRGASIRFLECSRPWAKCFICITSGNPGME